MQMVELKTRYGKMIELKTRYGMGSLAFLIVFAFPGVGSNWLNYMLPASRSPFYI